MCFSAGASFAGGVIISGIGLVTIKKVHYPSQLLFASIPLFFGFQQITEGFVWLLLPMKGNEAILHFVTYLFLLMAQVIWPVLIPLSVLFLERSEKRRKILKGLLLTGAILSAYYTFCLISFNVYPAIQGFHIFYDNDFPKALSIPSFLLYLIATIPPLFISSIKRTHMLGILMTLSCIVTGIFYTQFLLSVWCFFAALMSAVILWIMNDSHIIFKLEKLKLLNLTTKVFF